MDGKRRQILSFAVPAVLLAVFSVVQIFRPMDFRSSLYDLAGESAVPAAVRDHSARLVPIIVSSADAAAARASSERLYRALPTNACSTVRYSFDGEALLRTMDLCRRFRAGLASPRDAALLETADGRARIARAAARRYYSSPVPPLFGPSEDPFCLADGFVTSLPVAFSLWQPRDGVLTAERGGRTHILIVLELKEVISGNTGRLIEFSHALDAAIGSVRTDNVSISACGVPLHTARTAERCRTEINILSWFSLFFIAALSVCVFRSVRWIPLFAASLGGATLSGMLALRIFFPSVHIMTLVFGTTMLGLVIDYSFHWLMQRRGSRAETLRNLLVSFATTEISLIPLMVSSIPVLRQSAVFLSAGLFAALTYVVFGYPAPAGADAPTRPPAKLPLSKMAIALVLVGAACGWSRFKCVTDPAALYRPPPSLAGAERLFAELSGSDDGGRGFIVTAGSDDLETLLSREDSIGLPERTPRLSRFLPPLGRRRKIAADIEKLYAEHGGRQRELLGTGKLEPPPAPAAWRLEDVPPSAASAFLRGNSLVVASVPQPEKSLPEGCVFCSPRRDLGEMLSRWSGEVSVLLASALVMMFVALFVIYRMRVFTVMIPSLFALFSVLGGLGLCGLPVTLFHLLACFLLVGMGVDYTVFLHAGGSSAFRPAACSLLTSVAGFGALAFVSFPIVRSFGIVLGVGLPLAFFCACATAPRTGGETERCASPIGLKLLFLVYRLLGLRALYAASACVGFSAWLFSPSVRRASPSPKKVIAFTRSLADKLVVMSRGRRLPTVETDGSADARAFIGDVASRRGVFVLSSHCGTVEVLSALGECEVTFHAWMEFSRTSVFNAFYLKHKRGSKVVIHPVSQFGPETVFAAGDALDAGDCLVMAGDRGFGRMQTVPFRGGEISLPEGAFRFARALEHPVYFVACVATGGCRYRAIIRRLPSGNVRELVGAYARALDEVTREYPEQWFKWEGE